MTKLVIHVPHASTAIPEDVWSEFTVSRSDVEPEALASADLYTGEMARQAWPHAEIIETEVSRIVVDVERYDDDSSEEMAEVGRGVFYTCDHLMRPIREALRGPRREELLARYYWPHWKRLRAQAANAILVDLHTYPADPWPIERHARRRSDSHPSAAIQRCRGGSLSLSNRCQAVDPNRKGRSYKLQPGQKDSAPPSRALGSGQDPEQ